MIESFLLFLLGLSAGAVGVIVGIGGGIIIAPVLFLFFDLEPVVVSGTSLVLVVINSLVGLIVLSKNRTIDWRSGAIFGCAALPGSLVAPYVLQSVEPAIFKLILSFFVIAVSIDLFRSIRISAEPYRLHFLFQNGKPRNIVSSEGEVFRYNVNETVLIMFNAVLGFFSSFLGTGGGFIRTPLLITTFGFPIKVAVPTSLLAITIYGTVGAFVHISLDHVQWYPTLVFTGIGVIMGSQIGRLSNRFKPTLVLVMLGGILLVIGLKIGIGTFFF